MIVTVCFKLDLCHKVMSSAVAVLLKLLDIRLWSVTILGVWQLVSSNTEHWQNSPMDNCPISRVTEIAMNNYVSTWENMVSSDTGSTKIGGNKLRTYRMVKTEFETEAYVKCILGRQQRSALARFRCGTAAIRLGTGRYEGLPENERICVQSVKMLLKMNTMFYVSALYILILERNILWSFNCRNGCKCS